MNINCSHESLDIIFLSHFEILSIVLVSARINDDGFSREIMIKHLLKRSLLTHVLLVIVTNGC